MQPSVSIGWQLRMEHKEMEGLKLVLFREFSKTQKKGLSSSVRESAFARCEEIVHGWYRHCIGIKVRLCNAKRFHFQFSQASYAQVIPVRMKSAEIKVLFDAVISAPASTQTPKGIIAFIGFALSLS